YILGILFNVLKLLRLPLALLLGLWFLAWMLGRMSVTTKEAFSSFCFLPGTSRARFCSDASRSGIAPTQPPAKWADFPTLMDVQGDTMEQLLDENSSGSALALHLKKAEMATSDLVTMVQFSNLQCRDTLAAQLQKFVENARSTGVSLTDLNSRVFGAVDGIMSVNGWALRSIQATPKTNSLSVIIRYLNPWPTVQTSSITESFEHSMRYLSDTIRRLVIELEMNIKLLDQLERQLASLHETVSQEGIFISSARTELLGELWTFLGGNKRTLSVFQSNLQLLNSVSQYRKRALVHVVSALQKLRQLGGDVEELRRRVSGPELTGGSIPLEVHIESIQSGLERMKGSQARAMAREEVVIKKALRA
ncbi:hypothetical protein B0H12DRAFT_1014195, partial [Mycena haematopus]